MFRTLAIKLFNWLFPVRRDLTVQEINTVTHASIVPLENGRFGLVTRSGLVNSYARARDARRGATRLGLVVA